MYKIIGADGREYGPVSAEVLKEWIAQGRANAETKIRLEGATDWKALSQFPEFSQALSRKAAPLSVPQPFIVSATPRTNPMAIWGLVLGILSVTFGMCCYGLPFNIAGIIFSLVALSQIKRAPQSEQGRGMAIAGLVLSIASIVLALLLLALGMALRSSDILRKIQDM